MKRMKLLAICSIVILINSCVSSTEINSIGKVFHQVDFVPQGQNEFEGNLIVEVFNESGGKELKNTQITISKEKSVISKLSIETSIGVFSVEENNFSIQVEKSGYTSAKIDEISIPAGKACNVKFFLKKN